MSKLPPALSTSDLSEHAHFVQRLARRLSADGAAADDLAQEAWVAALESRPRAGAGLRSWLASVLRNLSAMQLRGASRRRDREARSARADVSESADAIVERMELHQRMLASVLQLPEAYRAAIVLRFLEGLPITQVAERLDIPHETARSRVRRGLAQLRAKLAQDYEGRSTWVVALADLGTYGLEGGRWGLPAIPVGAASGSFLLAAKIPMLVTVLVAAALVLTWSLSRPAGPPLEQMSTVAMDESDAQGTTSKEPDDETEGTARGSDRAIATAELDERSGPDARRLKCVILVEEASGTLRPAGDATLELRFDEEGPEEARSIEAFDGGFELELGDVETMIVANLVVEGLAGELESNAFEIPDTGGLTLRVRLLPPVSLRVRDEVSLGGLRDVQVLFGLPAYRDRIHPGRVERQHVTVDGAISPVELPPRTGQASYWVGAQGYGWKHILVDHGIGGEREVLLPRGAQLSVIVDGLDPSIDVAVRLYPEDEERSMRCQGELPPDASGAAVFRGLAEGSYQVRAEIGAWWDPPLRLATELVELAAGDRTEVLLSLDRALIGPEPVPVSGSLVRPPDRPELPVSLKIEPQGRAPSRRGDKLFLTFDELRRDDVEPAVLRFSAGNMTPGPYVAIVSELQFAVAFEVPRAPVRSLRIELPSLAAVRLDVVDGVTSAPIEVERIAWTRRDRPSTSVWAMRSEDPIAPGRFEFLAPLGPINVSVDTPGHASKSLRLNVMAAGAHSRVELVRLHSFVLILRDGDTPVPGRWGESSFELHRLQGSPEAERALVRGSEYELELDEGLWRFLVPEPGAYELRFPAFEGFEGAAPVAIDVRPGDGGEVEVQLARRR